MNCIRIRKRDGRVTDPLRTLDQVGYWGASSSQLQGWLASLTLEDEARQELGLPWIVFKYEDVFSEELLGLPSHRDVYFVIELLLGISPISMTQHRMTLAQLQELKVQLQCDAPSPEPFIFFSCHCTSLSRMPSALSHTRSALSCARIVCCCALRTLS